MVLPLALEERSVMLQSEFRVLTRLAAYLICGMCSYGLTRFTGYK